MTWNLILKFFSSRILVVQTLYIMNPTDATLASLSVLKKIKMASKMAVSYAPSTYLTNWFEKKRCNFDFYVCLEAK